MSVFERFHPRLQTAIVQRLGFASLRPVQDLAGAAILDGNNAVVLAPTAGGKTEASMFPTLSMVLDDPRDGVNLLYVAPIKALLNNQADRLGTYTEMVGLQRFVWHGDVGPTQRKQFLKEPAELLMTTPESLEVMLVSQRIKHKLLFEDLRAVVVDEVHALAGTDRGAHLMSVIERLARVSRHDVQRIGLSATVGNPEAIGQWLRGSSQRLSVVVDPPAKPSRRELSITYGESMDDVAVAASKVAKGRKSLFFCESRALTEATAGQMRARGSNVFVHHSSVSAEERHAAEEMFEHGEDACIVCTSTLELGIDVGDLDRVLQAEATNTVSSFLQRMGRTGRREGKAANTFFFCTDADTVLQAIALIELAKKRWVEDVPVNGRCWPVLVHQILATTLAFGAFRPEALWEVLRAVPDFGDVTYDEYEAVLEHMVSADYLYDDGRRLLMGEAAAEAFGRRNFMELYAVFSSPQLFVVESMSGRELGSLEQDFVDSLSEEGSSFLLGGRAWEVHTIDYGKRRVRVQAAGGGKKPRWGGFAPQFLGLEVSQRIRQVLAGDDRFAYLDPVAMRVLEDRRAWMRPLLAGNATPMVHDEGQTTWWTFAGGRINNTIRYFLKAMGHDVRADNFRVVHDGEGLSDLIDDLRSPSRIDELWEEVHRLLPDYRLSKFQPALPDWAVREMLEAYLLDVSAMCRFLG